VPRSKTVAAQACAVSGLMLAAGCSSSSNNASSGGSGSSGSSTNAATATSVTAFGGLSGLVAACTKEGTLNVITLPANWANYGTIMKDFTATPPPTTTTDTSNPPLPHRHTQPASQAGPGDTRLNTWYRPAQQGKLPAVANTRAPPGQLRRR
jgi:hypothetical protein